MTGKIYFCPSQLLSLHYLILEYALTLAIFDLDNTLLGGDSDHAWGEFIVAHQIVDPEAYQAQNDRFFNDYLAGKLDIQVYLNFCLQLLGEHETAQLNAWHEAFPSFRISLGSRRSLPRDQRR